VILLRALHAELLKIKRTIALKMVVITPAIFVALILLIGWQAPFSFLRREGFDNAWLVLANRHLTVWALLMLPLYITLQTALIAGLDHSENQWKSLLARCRDRGPSVRRPARRSHPVANSVRGSLCSSGAMGSDFPARRTGCRTDVFRPCHPALGQFAMEIIFDRFRHWTAGNRHWVHGCGRRAAVWRLAAVFSFFPSYAGCVQIVSASRSNTPY
jgi:hypothetical protein